MPHIVTIGPTATATIGLGGATQIENTSTISEAIAEPMSGPGDWLINRDPWNGIVGLGERSDFLKGRGSQVMGQVPGSNGSDTYNVDSTNDTIVERDPGDATLNGDAAADVLGGRSGLGQLVGDGDNGPLFDGDAAGILFGDLGNAVKVVAPGKITGLTAPILIPSL